MPPRFTNNNGKTVAGAAAWLHTISQNGGWDKHHEKVISEFVRKNMKGLQSLLTPEQRQSSTARPLRKVK